MEVTIDKNSGFCFGVVYAIEMAEEMLENDKHLYCLGDIVHNNKEVDRLNNLGLEFLVENEFRLPSLNSVIIPAGKNDLSIRTALLNDYQIEIGAGLGPLAGKIWRIGLMGHSAYKENVDRLLEALNKVL